MGADRAETRGGRCESVAGNVAAQVNATEEDAASGHTTGGGRPVADPWSETLLLPPSLRSVALTHRSRQRLRLVTVAKLESVLLDDVGRRVNAEVAALLTK